MAYSLSKGPQPGLRKQIFAVIGQCSTKKIVPPATVKFMTFSTFSLKGIFTWTLADYTHDFIKKSHIFPHFLLSYVAAESGQ